MSWWNTASSWASNLFSGSSSGSSSSNSNIWSSIISGVGSAAGSYMSGKSSDKDFANSLEAIQAQGLQSRQSLQFAAQLEDFYKQKGTQRKRAALNSYGKYNLMGDIMPTTSAPVDVPAQPVLT